MRTSQRCTALVALKQTAWGKAFSYEISWSLKNPLSTHHLASSHQLVVNSGTLLLSRLFALSCPRHGAETIIRVPTMAESITEGTPTQFRIQIGDYIEQDEELATIEPDKNDVR